MLIPILSPSLYRILICFILLFASLAVLGQKNSIKGVVKDTAAKKNLQYAMATLMTLTDTTVYKTVRTNEAGEFEITAIPAGKYTLLVSYPHMADFLQPITMLDTSKINTGKIEMVNAQVLLQEVIVKSGQAIRMRGDTLEYTADSFAVRPGANVQEMLKRLPGITVDRNGKITAQGKEVKKILVDGDEFFSDDPGLATQFLNADAIDKVQVFDKKSENADFTGIDDGKRTKTINLKLKNSKKNGAFGKAALGSDGDTYHNHEAMASLFSGAKKISVFGLSSKTGKEGIGYNELNKYVGQDYEMIDDGTGNSYSSNNEYENDTYYGGGLPDILSGGAHYSNRWRNNKDKLFSNYRVKQVNSVQWSDSLETTTLPDGTGFINKRNSNQASHDFTQKASGSFTTQIDSFSTLKVSVNGKLYNGNRSDMGNSSSVNEKGYQVNTSNNLVKSLWKGNNFGGNVTYQHKFRKEGRTITVMAQQDMNDHTNDDYNYSNNKYYDAATGTFTRADTLDQLQNTHNTGKSFGAKVSFTEKIATHFRLSADYGWKKTSSVNKFKTYRNDNGKYAYLLDSLSNNYDVDVHTNIAGTSVGFNAKKITITAGTKVFFTGLKQINNDANISSKRDFVNIAPQGNINWTMKENTYLSLAYNGETFQPSTDQLQPLRKSSNPLYVQIGNPDLVPGFRHNLSLSFYQYKWAKGTNISAYASMYYSENDITSKSTTDAQNRTVTQYINLNSVPGYNTYINYSWQYKKLHLRPSVTLNGNINGYNSFINGALVKSNNFSSTAGVSLNYDLPNKVSATYSGNLSFSKSKSTIATAKKQQTVSHTHVINATGYLPAKLELSSDCVFTFQPKNSTFNSSFNTVQWNASLIKKLLKNDRGFVKFSVNDILNRNTGYSRSINGSSIYESDRLTIKRYFLLTVGWNFLKGIQ